MRINSFAGSEALKANRVVLSPEESHHLARVLRVEAGQKLTLFDGQGTRAEAVVTDVSKKAITATVTARESVPPPAVDITLIQALPKPDRFETVLQKATELGVRCIQPVLSAHTVHRSRDPGKQMERWQTIIRNAAQQCGTAWLPHFQAPEKLSAVFPTLEKFDIALIGSLHPNARPFHDVFHPSAASGAPQMRGSDRRAWQPLEKSKIKTAALLIGPEGDFTEEEVNAAVAAGAVPVTFGKQILRTETAAVFGLSVLTYELF
ncbi:MAG: rRNA (uracil1498-N3)-methyltransferase [Verrucomicrobiota bacterium]|jgi:16S rRNA (uracil1498-N3)-methyltransferase|nr:rRNA (uracil1498-N3)-methyltransferase [Verrucomicrobiota bacterium]MDK2963574.1 rRNA (uracil1498-N3)-methyltransferase [Verrucomicrobiota bacterium]